ncbi:MAG: hypothetical protein AAGL69_13860 [Pseudomonadota bacterium]
MSRPCPINEEQIRCFGLPENGVMCAAGSVRRGCAVQFGAGKTSDGLLVGFHAFAAAEIVMACEHLCRQWRAEHAVEAPSLSSLLKANQLGREWAGDVLIVIEAASGLAKILAEQSNGD